MGPETTEVSLTRLHTVNHHYSIFTWKYIITYNKINLFTTSIFLRNILFATGKWALVICTNRIIDCFRQSMRVLFQIHHWIRSTWHYHLKRCHPIVSQKPIPCLWSTYPRSTGDWTKSSLTKLNKSRSLKKIKIQNDEGSTDR